MLAARLVLILGTLAVLASKLAGVAVTAEPPLAPPAPEAAGARPAQAWPAEAIVPLSEARIHTLPAAAQPPWRAYWNESVKRAGRLASRDLVDHSPAKPLPGGPIGASYSKGAKLGAPEGYYATAAAREIADRVVAWQTAVGGWMKSGDYTRDPRPDDNHHDAWSSGTFDNDATITEMRYLARVSAAGPADRATGWRHSFLRGVEYVLAAQYPNGGFPQIYPLVGGYHDAITFNDDAMVHILELLRDIGARRPDFAFVPAPVAARCRTALERGITCVLACQLRTPSGRLLVWGQQHDALTLQPCAARNFEPISACSSESAGLVHFLMSIPNPPDEIRQAVETSVAWFATHAFHEIVWQRGATHGTGLQSQAGAPDLWARFYDLATGRPVFGDRDRSIHFAVTELSNERRLGYAWFNSRAVSLPAAYEKWKAGLGR